MTAITASYQTLNIGNNMEINEIVNLILNGIVLLLLLSIMLLLFCGWVHDCIYMPLRIFVRKMITKPSTMKCGEVKWGEKYWG